MTLTVTDLLANTREVDGCLIWQGWKNDDGYGYVRFEGRDQPVHRVAYLLAVGPIPDGHEVDHRCQQRACLRVEDLEAVTHAENQRRIAARQMSCRRAGHDWTNPRNVRVRRNGRRYCAECDRQDQRARRHNRRAA
jgi:hypothetical protein